MGEVKERLAELAEEAIGQVQSVQLAIDTLRLAMERLEHIASQASDVVAPDNDTELAKALMIKAYRDTAKAIRGGTFWIEAGKEPAGTQIERRRVLEIIDSFRLGEYVPENEREYRSAVATMIAHIRSEITESHHSVDPIAAMAVRQ